MAKDHNRDVAKGELAGILRGYGLNPHLFDDLIREAIVNQWSPAQFTAELYGSDEFAAVLPGIFAPDGSLKVTPSQYLQMAYGPNGFVDIGKSFDLKLGVRKIGLLFEGNVSLDEWGFRAMALADAKANEVHRENYNAVLSAMGGEPLSKGDWFSHFAGTSTAKIENLVEAASLYGAPGLEISAPAAVEAAKAIGAASPMAQVDIEKLVQAAQESKDIVGPELAAVGITDADLAVLAAGSDPKGIRPLFEQIVRNRKLLTSSSAGGGGVKGVFPSLREGL